MPALAAQVKPQCQPEAPAGPKLKSRRGRSESKELESMTTSEAAPQTKLRNRELTPMHAN